MNDHTGTPQTHCPACRQRRLQPFYLQRSVPVHSVLLAETRTAAQGMARGDMLLGACERCGFVGNGVFHPELLAYTAAYESTQAYSATFDTFHQRLATTLVDHYKLQGKAVVEIGCGQGEFLHLLRRAGMGSVTGFDPAYMGSVQGEGLHFYAREFTSEDMLQTDLVVVKMTLEHIAQPAQFLADLRAAWVASPNALLFVQVPNAARVLAGGLFWDVYYEHCNYFTPSSLTALLARAGFAPEQSWTAYADQYLLATARPACAVETYPSEATLATLAHWTDAFAQRTADQIATWRARLAAANHPVIWGGGSKAVAFLSALGEESVSTVVDINPRRQSTFLPGSGAAIVAPPALVNDPRPDLVVVMNPVYCVEIGLALATLGLTPEIVALEDGPDG